MSLINEALKKAQRDRHLDSLPPIPGGGSRHGRRVRSMSTQTMVLIGAVGVSLFVVAVVGAVILINRQPPVPTPAVAKVAPKPASDPVASSPMIVLPVVVKPSPTPAVVPPSAPEPTPTPPPLAAIPTREPSAPIAITLGGSNLPSTRPSGDKFDERLQTLVDSWKVTAVRFSGNESKLFMNGSVFRVDDVVERASRLRLTKVSTTTLTFTDADGVDYVKRY